MTCDVFYTGSGDIDLPDGACCAVRFGIRAERVKSKYFRSVVRQP